MDTKKIKQKLQQQEEEVRQADRKLKKTEELSAYEGLDKVILIKERVEEIRKERGAVKPFVAKSGLSSLDETIEGFRPGNLIILTGPTKNGKCLAKGTKVLMADGKVKKVEKIKVGDEVMGVDSKPREVLSLGQGTEKMYKIKNRDGSSFVCNESHILSLKRTLSHKYRYDNPKREKRPRKNNKGKVVNISVKDYLNSSKTFKHLHKAYKTGVDFEEKTLPINPYFLGLWLGDGTTTNVGITTADKEVEEYIYDYAKELGLDVTVRNKEDNLASTYSIVRQGKHRKRDSLQEKLREINILGNKHIPFEYKVNSKDNRMRLLAGLIDSDGCFNSPCSISFTNKNEQLCEDVLFLARSLGFYASCKKPQIVDGVEYQRVYISGDIKQIPCLLARKLKGIRKRLKETTTQNFTIEEAGMGKYYGFELGGDSLFLLENFIVTHNSQFSRFLTQKFSEEHKCLWFPYEETYEEMVRHYSETADFYVPRIMTTGNLDWIENRILEAKAKFGTQIVFIDHLDFLRDTKLLSSLSLNMSGYIGGIVQKIKRIAVEQELCVILMCHIKKNNWHGKELPTSEDIRDSGQIPQLADLVLMLKRDLSDNSDEIYAGTSVLGVIENRYNGKTRKIKLNFENGKYTEITDRYSE